MTEKHAKPLKIRTINSICAMAVLGSVIYMLFAGVQAAALGVLALSLIVLAVPVISSGEGVLAIVAGIFVGLLEGAVLVLSLIAGLLAAIFS